VYNNAQESKLDMSRDFKNQTIIYMWFNKITGKVYIGSGVDGSLRLSRYFMASVLKANSRIYKNILKYGHDSFSVSVLEVTGKTGSVSKTHYLAREQFYLDWALKTYGLSVLNLLHETSSSLGFKHSLETKKLLAAVRTGKKHSETTKQSLREMFLGENNPF
jgi:group I intron endonuclease